MIIPTLYGNLEINFPLRKIIEALLHLFINHPYYILTSGSA